MLFFFYSFSNHRDLHSFPTRRSSDLQLRPVGNDLVRLKGLFLDLLAQQGDRKSTRLNSSHRTISYAVFCLKKKNPDLYFTEILSRMVSHLHNLQSIVPQHNTQMLTAE